MSFALIVLDLDGTLTNSDKIITPRTLSALERAMDEGARVVLASGRPTYGIAPLADQLRLHERGGYVLAYNGGRITDWATAADLYHQHLPADVLPLLHQYARQHHYALLGYRNDTIITELPSDEYVAEEARINKMKVEGVENLLEALEPDPVKLLMTGQPAKLAEAEQEVQQIVADRMEVYRSAPFFLELVPHGIDKALSLQRLLAVLALDRTDMIAFGDGYNDLSMLRLAGTGVAMANAVAEVRAEADFVTLDNDHDGVAHALEKFFEW